MLDGAVEKEQRDGYTFERFDLSGNGWEHASQIITPLEADAFGNHGFSSEELNDSLQQPKTVMIVAKNGAEILGFTYAVPRSYWKDEAAEVIEREDNGDRTAYVYDTVVAKKHRGKKISLRMMSHLHSELAKEGYEFLERDSVIDGGYADQIQKAYTEKGLMVQAGPDHDSDWGKQRFFRMKLPQQTT